MKKLFIALTLFTAAALCLGPAFAQCEPSTQIGLPEGAKARFGRGNIKEIAYFPNGTRFAIVTTIGVWITMPRPERNLTS